MRTFLACCVALFTLVLLGSAPGAQPAEKRIALVVGNGGYQAKALPTSANDAGLIAQTLQAAGFDVVGARDLDQDSLRRAFRDFLEKAAGSGPDTVAFVYLNGYGLQLEGENYFLPVDARIERDADLPAEAVRVSDYIRRLAALRLKASMVVLDAARRNPFSVSGEPLAGGLALVEPSPGMLVAFNAAPGTIAPEQDGPYGAYAQALAEMMREGGLSLSDLFEQARLRVNDMTKGAQVPWNSSRVEAPFVFFERSADAPAPVASAEQTSAVRSQPIRELGAQDAYVATLARDTLQDYEEFLGAYPGDPMAKRVRAIIAARRESMTWRRTSVEDTPDAYWSYLRRYPRGPHCADARRRLAERAAALEPPAAFTPIEYDVPAPLPEEAAYIDRPVLAFDDPDFGFAPPPPPAVYFLRPPPPEFVVLLAPPPPVDVFDLPIPVFVPVPVWCHPPIYVAPPPHNVIFNNIHNTVIINNVTKVVTIKDQRGQIVSSAPSHAPGVGAVALGAALPPSLAKRAALIQPQGRGVTSTIAAQPSDKLPLGQPLPGMNGHTSPPLPGKLVGAPTGVPAAKNAANIQTRGVQPQTVQPRGFGLTSAPPVQQASKLPVDKLPLDKSPGHALPGTNGHALPTSPGKRFAPPSGGSSAALAPAVIPPTVHKPQPQSMPTHTLSTALPAAVAKPRPELPVQQPQPSPSISARTTAPPAITHRSPPPQTQAYHAPPPAKAYRPPSPPVATYRPASLPTAAYHPAPPPVARAAPQPVVRAAPPSVVRAAPPPVVRAAPTPVVRAAPPPAYRPPPPAVHAAAPRPSGGPAPRHKS
jgi:uncharacterized caspase-like protein